MATNKSKQNYLSYKSSIKADDYDNVLRQIQSARAEAVDMRKRLDQINIDDDPDPKKREQYQSFLNRMATAVNRWRGVVQGPDRKPGFWDKVLHPFGGNQNIREQIVSIDRDNRRLRLSNVRDDFQLLKEQTEIMKDITDDIMVDPNYDLKSYSVKSNQTLRDKLDIIIKGFDDTISDMTHLTKKDMNTSGAKMNYTDKSEKAAIDAALRYYRSMKATSNDVIEVKKSVTENKVDAKGWPFSGSGNGGVDLSQQELNETGFSDSTISELGYGSPEATVTTVIESDPQEVETLGSDVEELGQAVDAWGNNYGPDAPPQQQDTLLTEADKILISAQGVMSKAEELHANGTLDDQLYAQLENSVGGISRQFGQVMAPSSDVFYNNGIENGYASYSKSVLNAMKNLDYPVTIKGAKINPKLLKSDLKKSASNATNTGKLVKKKASKLKVLKDKIVNFFKNRKKK